MPFQVFLGGAPRFQVHLLSKRDAWALLAARLVRERWGKEAFPPSFMSHLLGLPSLIPTTIPCSPFSVFISRTYYHMTATHCLICSCQSLP